MAKKALMKATKENKDFEAMKKEQNNNTFDNTRAGSRETSPPNTTEAHMSPGGPRPVAGAVQDAGNTTTFESLCRSRQLPKDDKRCSAAHDMYQDDNDKEVATQEFYMERLNFNFDRIRSVIIIKLKV